MTTTIQTRKVHAILVANEQAERIRRDLEDTTPEELGWPGMTPEELIASEWQCWFEEELMQARAA